MGFDQSEHVKSNEKTLHSHRYTEEDRSGRKAYVA